MGNTELNKTHKDRMKGTCDNSCKFEWQDGTFMGLLLGGLPEIHDTGLNDESRKPYARLESLYRTYSAFSTDKEIFFSDVKELVATIRTASPRWYALNLANVKDALDMHKCCIISGDGDIGKSYFVKCFEEELEKRQINHLCLYGKFLKNIDVIDFDGIKELGASEEYVFVFDAVNEISDTEQIVLLDKVKEIIKIHGVRVVLTYRNHDVSVAVLNLIQEMGGSQYEFPGVSFESALEWLQKLPVADVSEYIDVLYSNNPS